MQFVRTPRIMISGVRSGVGKSLLGLGIALELRRRGISFSVCLLSPSIAQSILYRRISGRYTRCLSDKFLSAGQVLEGLFHASTGSDLVLIDGHAGLYDGSSAGSLNGSDAEVAALTRTPVALVADSRGFGTSLAALFKGYEQFSKGFNVAGMVANWVDRADPNYFGETRDRDYYEAIMQSFSLPHLLGGVPEANFDIPFIPGGFSQEQNSAVVPRQFLSELGNMVAEFVDIDAILKQAANAPEVLVPDIPPPSAKRKCRIAISDDVCFGLCFQDNLDLLRYYGADLVPFSPIADTDLPDNIGAVYLTGAYLAEYGHDLGVNAVMRKSILEFVKAGGLILAEGASPAYLSREFRWGGTGMQAEGVRLFDTPALSAERRFSYCDGATIDDSILGRPGNLLKGICTNEWRFGREFPVLKTLRVSTKEGMSFIEGYSPEPHAFITFCLWHFGSNPEIAKNLVDAAEIASI